MIDVALIRSRYASLSPHLDERGRRLFVATEARVAGYGGIVAVSCATGIAPSTIGRGLRELDEAEPLVPGWVRRKGGGRKTLVESDPGLLAALLALVHPTERGCPMSPLRWTCLSLRHLAEALTVRGHPVSHMVVGTLLKAEGFSLQANRRTLEGSSHPDRDAQFAHIARSTAAALAEGQPVISVDTKKKELVGLFKNPGREWRPQGTPEEVRVHDFLIEELGRAVPYGVYDLAANAGWVSVCMDYDIAAFAVQAIRRWWQEVGGPRYPRAKRLTITADAGGSNGSRVRLWKRELQRLSDELGLEITVHHLPPGTSKWNKIGVSRTHLRGLRMWSCTRDGGRPPEAGSQVLVSNHCKLRPSKAVVVSVAAKGGARTRQVWSGEASESKPSMTCRNSIGDVKTGGAIFSRDQLGGGPEACPSGIRHVGGAKPDQALVWNVRTCCPDAKGDVRAAETVRISVPKRGTGAEQFVVGTKVL